MGAGLFWGVGVTTTWCSHVPACVLRGWGGTKELLQRTVALVEECGRIRQFLDSVHLEQIYSRIRTLENRITVAESGGAPDRLIEEKISLMHNFEGYREKEKRLGALVSLLGAVRTSLDGARERMASVGGIRESLAILKDLGRSLA